MLKGLAQDGATYENWVQYQELARAAAEAWNTHKADAADKLHKRFFELANLKDFTPEQLSKGVDTDRLIERGAI